MEYNYLGDRFTAPELVNMECNAVRNESGKCIRGRNGNMLVSDKSGRIFNVCAKRLRKTEKKQKKNGKNFVETK